MTAQTSSLKKVISVIVGPLVFAIVLMLPIAGIEHNAQIVLALYAWMVAWWMTNPIPWAITALLPLVVIPIFDCLSLSKVAGLYGQRILFFLIGVSCFAIAINKYNLGKRLALLFVSSKKDKQSLFNILVKFMCVVAIMSAFVDDAASVAICLPVGLSISGAVVPAEGFNKKRFDTAVVLGTLYASEAGGLMTIAGIPHIAIAISALEEMTGTAMTFLEWSRVGVVVGIVSLVIYMAILYFFTKIKNCYVESTKEFVKQERAYIGPISTAEKNIIVVFAVMLILWILPNFVEISFLNVWFVPTVGAILLYLLPNGNNEKILDKSDFANELPWNIIFLVTGGTVMASLCTDLGVVSWIQSIIPTDMNTIPFLIAMCIATIILTNFVSGTAAVSIMVSIFLPIAIAQGIDPHIIVFLLPCCGMAIMFPWAGAATGSTFSSGKVSIGDMVKCGGIATVCHMIVSITLVMILCNLFY